MQIPYQFLPKLNARRVTIPLLSPLDEQEFSIHFAQETPFLIEADLSSLLQSALSQIQKVMDFILLYSILVAVIFMVWLLFVIRMYKKLKD